MKKIYFLLIMLLTFSSWALQSPKQPNNTWILSESLENAFEDIAIQDLQKSLNSLDISLKIENRDEYLAPYKIDQGQFFSIYLAPFFYSPDHVWILENSPSFTPYEELSLDQLKELEHFRYLIGEIYLYMMGYDGYSLFIDLGKNYGHGRPTVCMEMIPTKFSGIQKDELDINEKCKRIYYMLFNSDQIRQLSAAEALKKITTFRTYMKKLKAENRTLSNQKRIIKRTLPWRRKTTNWQTLINSSLVGLKKELEADYELLTDFQSPQLKYLKKNTMLLEAKHDGEFTRMRELCIHQCAFCNPQVIENQLVYQLGDFDCLYNFRPYTIGAHFMITPHHPIHVENWQHLSLQDVLTLDQFSQSIVSALKQDSGRTDVILFVQNGMAGGMTVPHGHLHILLRPTKLHFHAQLLLESTNHKRKGLSAGEMSPVKEKYKKKLEHLLASYLVTQN